MNKWMYERKNEWMFFCTGNQWPEWRIQQSCCQVQRQTRKVEYGVGIKVFMFSYVSSTVLFSNKMNKKLNLWYISAITAYKSVILRTSVDYLILNLNVFFIDISLPDIEI